mmetsp:Transcript_13927/g.41450  ORF Transcript_13927/g.41450 Transcript_13927/m.41450 type:complete len:95 (+) Transcript_13927:469-753(+)
MMSRGPIDEPSSVDWDKEWKKVSSQAPVPEQKEVVEEEEVAVPLPKADRPKGMDGMNELERNTVRATRRVAGLGKEVVRNVEDTAAKAKKIKVT